jgi:hypothetical protein
MPFQSVLSDSILITFRLAIQLEDIVFLRDLIVESSSSIKLVKNGKIIPLEVFLILDGIFCTALALKSRIGGICPYKHEMHELLVFLCSKCWDFFIDVFEKYSVLIPEAACIPFWLLSCILQLEDEQANRVLNGSDGVNYDEASRTVIGNTISDHITPLLSSPDKNLDLADKVAHTRSYKCNEVNPDLKNISLESHTCSSEEFLEAIHWLESVHSLHLRLYTRTRRKTSKKQNFSADLLRSSRKFYDDVVMIEDYEEVESESSTYEGRAESVYRFGYLFETSPRFLRFWQ